MNREQRMTKARRHSEFFYYLAHVYEQTAIKDIAEDFKVSPSIVSDGIHRVREAIARVKMLAEKFPDVHPADREFYEYCWQLPRETRTVMAQRGGYYLFYKLNGWQLIPIDAATDVDAERIRQDRALAALDNCVEKFPTKHRAALRKIFRGPGDETVIGFRLEKRLKQMSAGDRDKFWNTFDAFDGPRCIRHFPPEGGSQQSVKNEEDADKVPQDSKILRHVWRERTMGTHESKPLLYLKIDENGVIESRVAAGTLPQAEAGTQLLSKIQYEIFLLSQAAKSAWTKIEAEQAK